ncbi:MAG: TlpA family protein disulfide reductase [Gammaproteobacteria bacterium]|nr:TlpA family protein disulfide reductase [Gammaproteobacteria bacterium]
MKRISAAALLCAATTFTTAVLAADAAPDFKLPSAKGMVELSKLKGKVVYVDFWASWCTPCRKSFPWMNEMHKKFKEQGLEVIAINLDKSREPIDEFLSKTPADFTIAYDPSGGAASSYKVSGMPSTYLIDRSGQLQVTHIGFRDKDKQEMESKIKELLAKK